MALYHLKSRNQSFLLCFSELFGLAVPLNLYFTHALVPVFGLVAPWQLSLAQSLIQVSCHLLLWWTVQSRVHIGKASTAVFMMASHSALIPLRGFFLRVRRCRSSLSALAGILASVPVKCLVARIHKLVVSTATLVVEYIDRIGSGDTTRACTLLRCGFLGISCCFKENVLLALFFLNRHVLANL